MTASEEAVFAEAGRALFHAHRFEHNLKGLAALVYEIGHARRPVEPVGFSRLSLGPLLDAARNLTEDIPDVEALFENARERRNALCHSLLHDRRHDLESAEGRARLVEDLRSDVDVLSRSADLASDLLRRLVAALEARLRVVE